MNGRDDALYRLQLAEHYLEDAEQEFDKSRFSDCVGSAQEAVENSAKAIVACFWPVEKSHEPDRQLRQLLQKANLPKFITAQIEAAWDTFTEMGTATHIRATYGDEENRIPPWVLVSQNESESALRKARAAVALARDILKELLGPLDSLPRTSGPLPPPASPSPEDG